MNELRSPRNVQLSIMTWNIYQGADFAPIFTAPPEQIPLRVTEVFRQFLATDFLRRAGAIANQIELEEPDIVGLQEAVIVELIPPNSHEVIYDFIEILLNKLALRGLRYRLAARNKGIPTELPSSSGNVIRYTDRDAILIREGCSLKGIRKQEGNYINNLQLEVGNQQIIVKRGWSAIDVSVQGHMLRVVNTHLEPLSPKVQVAQANELLAGPGQTELPLVFIGDFNSKADGTGTPTYGNLIAAGFKDTWLIAGKGDGFTSYQEADLLNAQSKLSERIDLILIKNMEDWIVGRDELVGEDQCDRTYTRLWPSDHAGVVADFKIEN